MRLFSYNFVYFCWLLSVKKDQDKIPTVDVPDVLDSSLQRFTFRFGLFVDLFRKFNENQQLASKSVNLPDLYLLPNWPLDVLFQILGYNKGALVHVFLTNRAHLTAQITLQNIVLGRHRHYFSSTNHHTLP